MNYFEISTDTELNIDTLPPAEFEIVNSLAALLNFIKDEENKNTLAIDDDLSRGISYICRSNGSRRKEKLSVQIPITSLIRYFLSESEIYKPGYGDEFDNDDMFIAIDNWLDILIIKAIDALGAATTENFGQVIYLQALTKFLNQHRFKLRARI